MMAVANTRSIIRVETRFLVDGNLAQKPREQLGLQKHERILDDFETGRERETADLSDSLRGRRSPRVMNSDEPFAMREFIQKKSLN